MQARRRRATRNPAMGCSSAAHPNAEETGSTTPPTEPTTGNTHLTSPIRQLPQELLLVIFTILAVEAKPLLLEAGQKPLHRSDIPWLVLPSVCSWWRETSDLCFDLWTVINFWTAETTKKLLLKSKDRPLDLAFVSGRYSQFSSKAAVFSRAQNYHHIIELRARFIKFALEDMPREEYNSESADWSKVTACSRVLETILSTPAPQVVSLHLANTLDFEEMPRRSAPDMERCHHSVVSSDYPMLRQLHLVCWVRVPPDDFFFRLPLTSLTFERGVYFNKFGEFLDLLMHLPTLEVFRMDNQDNDIFDPFDAFDEDSMADALARYQRDPGNIGLPKLQLFELIFCDTDIVVEIMRWISVPLSTRMVLRRIPNTFVTAEDVAQIHDEVEGLLETLVTHFSPGDTTEPSSAQGLDDIVSTAETSTTDEAVRTLSTLHVRAHRLCRGSEDDAAPTTGEYLPQLDMSLSFCTDELPHTVITEVLSQLPRLLGNVENRRLQKLSSFESTSRRPIPPGGIIYSIRTELDTEHAAA